MAARVRDSATVLVRQTPRVRWQGASFKEGKDELDPANYSSHPAPAKPGNLCWEVVRILLVVGGVLGVVLAGAYWVGTRLSIEDMVDDGY